MNLFITVFIGPLQSQSSSDFTYLHFFQSITIDILEDMNYQLLAIFINL